MHNGCALARGIEDQDRAGPRAGSDPRAAVDATLGVSILEEEANRIVIHQRASVHLTQLPIILFCVARTWWRRYI